MVKTGIGAIIFAIIFGVIFAYSAFLFVSVIADLDIADAGIFAGPAAVLGGLIILGSGIAAGISGILTIILLISGINNMKSYIRLQKVKNQ